MCRLEDDEVARIVQSLESNQQLSELSLGMNYAEDDAMLAVCNLLRSSRSGLKSLNLAQQNPGTLDLISFAVALRENRTLQRIDFRESFVQHVHVAALAEALNHNATVQELNLENCGLTNSMLSTLVKRLDGWSGLMKLYLRDNGCGNQLDAATLKGNCILQVLDIEQELMHPNVYFHLCLNRGGRQFLETNRIPLALWSILFFRVNRIFEEDDSIPPDSHHGIGAADVLYYLLKGSVF
jgi:Ran GTPase-activating protein (RanGAP) involved in mRNA processing and transport